MADSTPDSQQARYEARQRPERTTADYMDESYEDGRQAGLSQGSRPSSSAGGKVSIGAPLVVETLLISVNAITTDKRPPLPSQLLIAFGFFGLLSLASGSAAAPAAAVGWGVVLATFYSGANGKGAPPAIGALNTLGQFFGGQYQTKGSAPSTAGTETTSVTSEAGTTALEEQ